MAMERKISKPAVKITGTAKSTGGNVRNQTSNVFQGNSTKNGK